MASNPYVNKVVYNGSTLVDLTEDTVSPDTLINGYTAHNKSGAPITGNAVIPTKVSELQNDAGYLKTTTMISVSNMSEGTTYTFPDSIKNSKIVVISFRRYGYFASMAAIYFALNNGANDGTIVRADNGNRYVTFKVANDVLTILHEGLGSPTMEIMGIM